MMLSRSQLFQIVVRCEIDLSCEWQAARTWVTRSLTTTFADCWWRQTL